jgi:hypothetical protein
VKTPGRIAVLPGQQHIAMNTAPDLFLGAVLGFLTTALDQITNTYTSTGGHQ